MDEIVNKISKNILRKNIFTTKRKSKKPDLKTGFLRYNKKTMSLTDAALFSSLITMAILISACGNLITSTSSRLARVVDISRNLCEKAKKETDKKELEQIFYQLESIGPRIKFIETALTLFYVSISSLALAALFMSVDSIFPVDLIMFTVVCGMMGVLILPIASILLVIERQFTMKSVWQEIDYVNKLFGRNK